jgi:hypothetical protein
LREDLKVADNNKLAEVKELLNSLTVLEAAQLAKDLQDEWGVSAAAPAMAAMPGMMAPAAEAEAEEEEKTEFDIYITDVGPQRPWRPGPRPRSVRASVRTMPSRPRSAWKRPAQRSTSGNSPSPT